MTTHDDKEKARLYITKGEACLRHSMSAIVTVLGLGLAALLFDDLIIGRAGLGVLTMAVALHLAGSAYLRAAQRLMNRQSKRSPRR